MAAPYLSLQDIHLTFGGTPLIEGAELFVHPGDRLALVGRNGSGKSTLLKVAAGMLEADRGKRVLQAGVTLRYLSQEPHLVGYANTLAFASEGLQHDEDLHRARHLLEDLGLRGDENPARLSGGEARRAALARALAPQPDILLLDEPTNHLDLPAIEWLESYLRGTRSALVLISHDRRFLSSLSRATLWLDRGRVRRLEQGFSAFEAWRDEVLAEEEREAHKLDRKIVAEEHWVRYGVTARRKRNVRRMAELEGLRKKRRERSRAPGSVRLAASEAELSGKLVLEAKGIAKSYGDRAIIKDLDLLVARGDRLALVGANGSGKTTLLNLLTGRLAPDSGSVRLGASLQMVVLDQGRAALDPALSVSDTLTQGRGDKVTVAGQSKHVMSYMKDFLFQPEQARTPVGVLSGGERGRLLLAVALAQPSNLLVLDEPTNDLDLETLDLLQEMLADYPGTVLLVSHDRDFLDRVATSVLMNEGEGRWLEYAGGYSDMVAQRGEGVRAAAVIAAPAEKRSAEKPREATRQAKVKMTFAQQQALKTLPEKIGTLEKGIGRLREKLADGAFYQRDPQGFAKAGEQLAELEKALAGAEEEWLALEILREEIEEK